MALVPLSKATLKSVQPDMSVSESFQEASRPWRHKFHQMYCSIGAAASSPECQSNMLFMHCCLVPHKTGITMVAAVRSDITAI